MNELILLVHVFVIVSWLGAMFFNLVLIFPAYKAVSSGIEQEVQLYKVQGTRAAPWLYCFMVLTLISGVYLSFFSATALPLTVVYIKLFLLSMMVLCHLFGSYFVWPRIMFALGEEARGWLNWYQMSMLASASLGSVAIIVTYLLSRDS